MKQVLTVILPRQKDIEQIRQAHIPNLGDILPHITLVYPFEVKDQNLLFEHIETAIKPFSRFSVELRGTQTSAKDYYLYLLVQEGALQLKNLHESMLSGILSNFSNPDMPEYIPHLTLGVFSDRESILSAKKSIDVINPSLSVDINSIQLLTIGDNHELVSRRDFLLSN